jgi:hypothetical protein
MAPYGANITEPIVTTIGNPVYNQVYATTTVAYDVSIGGQPFFLNNNDDSPYRRVTAQYRKQQIDQTREPGEQTLTGWWLRSQSSFHLGQGVKFFEPAQDESLRFQYTYSKGCNVWTKGQITLLNTTTTSHYTTGDLQPNKRPFQIARSIRPSWTVTNKALTSNVATLTIGSHKLVAGNTVVVDNIDATFNGTYVLTAVGATTISYARTASNVTSVASTGLVTQDAILLWDKYDVDKIDSGGQLTHFIDYTAGVNDPVYSICDDGVYAYWVTNVVSGTSKMHVYKKLLTDDSTVAGTLMFNATGIVVTNAVIEFTKERLVLAVNNSVYEFATSATALPSAVYTHPTNNFVYTSITSSGAAIYLSGFTGIQSTIQKFTLTSNGSMPTLTSAITAAELPVGEIVFKIYFYLNWMAIGTSLGLRIADASAADGSLAYGPLVFESEQPVYDVAGYDKYLWATTNVDGNPGTTRIDLGQQIGSNLVFAYAWDLYDPSLTGFTTTSCSFLGNTDRLAFCTANNGTTNGSIYLESATDLVATATFRTGYVRYNTLENKIFKYIVPRFDTTDGGLIIRSIDQFGNQYGLGSYPQGSEVGQVGISYPPGAQQYLGFEFEFSRSTSNAANGPTFTGYQLKVLPAIPRQRLIQYPCSLYDSESDKFGNKAGYDGSAYDRLKALESIESNGDTIKIEDFRTNESFTGIIEEIDFINRTPTDKRYSGYGGLMLVTIRTIS